MFHVNKGERGYGIILLKYASKTRQTAWSTVEGEVLPMRSATKNKIVY